MPIMAIVGDANMYCLECARKRYGAEAIDAVEDGYYTRRLIGMGEQVTRVPLDALNGIEPKDREGNVLGAVGDWQYDDLHDMDTAPDKYGERPSCTCGDCGTPLVESDYRAPVANNATCQLPERDSDGELPSYAWPGGYTLIYYTQDSATLCGTCATSVLTDPYAEPITGCAVYYEGPTLQCDECGKGIESSYGDPDEPEGEDETDTDPWYHPHISDIDETGDN